VHTDGNLRATRNLLSYWPSACEVRPQFQHVLNFSIVSASSKVPSVRPIEKVV